MNSRTITNILKSKPSTAKYFKGVYPIDRLPALNDFPCYIIVNTSHSSVNHGHWVLIYFKDSENVIFFDSFGRHPKNVNNGHILYSYIRNYNVHYSEYILQSKLSSVCGYYCIYVAYNICNNISLHSMFCMFSKEVDYNDVLIVTKVQSIFSYITNVL
jgi:hypothetical protein